MTEDQSAWTCTIESLQAGRVAASIVAVAPISFHGMPGLAQRLTLRLVTGESVEGLQLGTQQPLLANPIYRISDWPGGRSSNIERTLGRRPG
jgi:hypothetical protein